MSKKTKVYVVVEGAAVSYVDAPDFVEVITIDLDMLVDGSCLNCGEGMEIDNDVCPNCGINWANEPVEEFKKAEARDE